MRREAIKKYTCPINEYQYVMNRSSCEFKCQAGKYGSGDGKHTPCFAKSKSTVGSAECTCKASLHHDISIAGLYQMLLQFVVESAMFLAVTTTTFIVTTVSIGCASLACWFRSCSTCSHRQGAFSVGKLRCGRMAAFILISLFLGSTEAACSMTGWLIRCQAQWRAHRQARLALSRTGLATIQIVKSVTRPSSCQVRH